MTICNVKKTKEQLKQWLKEFNIDAVPPPKGRQLLVAFPKFLSPNVVTITRLLEKTDKRETLYNLEMADK